MKKHKLKLEKFTISKLKNQHEIFGGTGNDGTGTWNPTESLKCIETSKKFVVIKEDEGTD